MRIELWNIDIDDFMVVLSMLMVKGFDRGDVRSGFGLSIDIDVLSIADGGDVRSGVGMSILVA